MCYGMKQSITEMERRKVTDDLLGRTYGIVTAS